MHVACSPKSAGVSVCVCVCVCVCMYVGSQSVDTTSPLTRINRTIHPSVYPCPQSFSMLHRNIELWKKKTRSGLGTRLPSVAAGRCGPSRKQCSQQAWGQRDDEALKKLRVISNWWDCDNPLDKMSILQLFERMRKATCACSVRMVTIKLSSRLSTECLIKSVKEGVFGSPQINQQCLTMGNVPLFKKMESNRVSMP